MTSLQDIQKVFFIGIGGIGMSALARYFHENGGDVSGYDRTSSILTRQLEKEGIKVYYEEEVNEEVKQAELIVYTPAIGRNNVIYDFGIKQGKPVYKRSEVLEMILKNMQCIAVAGTHGKTTISCMIAHILRDSGWGSHAFLGGLAANYGVNYWSSDRPLAVVEADEYDRSFLRLSPDKAVLTAMDADHLDIYGTVEKLQEAFIAFTNKIKPGGLLVYGRYLKKAASLGGSRKRSYALQHKEASIHATNIRVREAGYTFDAVVEKEDIKEIQLSIGGKYNVENALAAIAICRDVGIEKEKIRSALASFKGVKRRFEYLIKEENQVYIDDYAHHPEELRKLLSSVKEQFPQDDCTLIFQPHLYSRTRDYLQDFAEVLDLADRVILLPVYPAREAPIEGVSSKAIADLMKKDKVVLSSKKTLFSALRNDSARVLITAGAGDIGAMTEGIKNFLKNKGSQQ